MESTTEIARIAGAAIVRHDRRGVTERAKEDAAPVIAADKAAKALISFRLRELTLLASIVSEDSSAPCAQRASPVAFQVVDPLDGTKEFIHERDEFTVRNALIEDAVPVLGVVYLPARAGTHAGLLAGRATLMGMLGRQSIRRRPLPTAGATVAVGHSHGDLAHDAYPRAGAMQWDTAAGHAVPMAAEGSVGDRPGRPLTYGKSGFANLSFVAPVAFLPQHS